jgi:glycosyltransferase involved in cell wall biosynthesis
MRFLISAVTGKLPIGVKLVIAGGGNTKVFQDSEIHAGDDVVLAGRVSDEELVALYGNAYALIFPSLTEGFGLPPIEAMRCGCPVISSTGGALPEICGDAAIYADPKDGDAWVNAIQTLWADSAGRAELIAKGSKRCLKYSWEQSARQVLKILDEG